MDTLLLDTVTWDLVADASGNIARATAPYALAQDAASACRLFAGELWYDTAQGVPYFQLVLGQFPSLGLVKALLVEAALTVPNVVAAAVYFSDFEDRALTGQVQITDNLGRVAASVVAAGNAAIPPLYGPITDAGGNVITLSAQGSSFGSITDAAGNVITDAAGNVITPV